MALVLPLTDTNDGAVRKFSIEVWCCNGRLKGVVILLVALVVSFALMYLPVALLLNLSFCCESNAYQFQPWPVVCSQQDPDCGINISSNLVSECWIGKNHYVQRWKFLVRRYKLRCCVWASLKSNRVPRHSDQPLKSAISPALKAVGTVSRKH
jgi:hypothetical protein